MSVIASKWAYSQPIKNPVAKNILAFLASHNFQGNKTFFTIQTISGATAYSRRAVIDNLKWLCEHQYLLKEIRMSEDGGQRSNVYVLNINEEYVNDFCSNYAILSTPPVQEVHGGGAGGARGGVQEVHPNNNVLNNNFNKSFYVDKEQKKNKEDFVHKNQSTLLKNRTTDSPDISVGHLVKSSGAEDTPMANETKHDFADSMDQMAREKKHIEAHEEIKRAPMPEDLRRLCKAIGAKT